MKGEEKLRQFSETAYRKTLTKVNDRVYHFLGYGHSNCTGILGNSSWILVDTLDTDARAARVYEELKKICDVPVKTIIYTHGHPDHRAGAGAFKEMNPEIIAFAPVRAPLKYYEKINDFLNYRGRLQHGYGQSDEEAICQGIGPREGMSQNDGVYAILPPATVYTEEKICRNIDGVEIEMRRAPGETDDQILVYLPEWKVICTGDNYYGAFPNLYAIRGTQYRDIAQWIDSLRLILSYDSEALLPGHTAALTGKEAIQKQVGTFADALEAVLFDTLDCMNQCMGLSETVEHVKLRPEYRDLPFLGEYYGTVEWAVRSIYNGYVGWFDGNAAYLMPVSEKAFNNKLHELISEEKLQEEIKACMEKEDYQMALQLIEIAEDKSLRNEALMGRASQMTSANARHYLIGTAKGIR